MTHTLTEARLGRFPPNAPTLGGWTTARHLVENLSYTASRLRVIWPSRFPTLESAKPDERQPGRLANYVYANRLSNGIA